jgi:hypothetical protein
MSPPTPPHLEMPRIILSTLIILSTISQARSAITSSDVTAYNSWSTYPYSSKLNFLLYSEDWDNLREEFMALDRFNENDVTLDDFTHKLSDYQDADTISEMHTYCTTVPNDDNISGRCDFYAYVLTRGLYDVNGNVFDDNEWSIREQVFLTSYQERAASTDITEEELRLMGIHVGEDGIIVDGVDEL